MFPGGLPLDSGVLRRVSPNATPQEQINVLNDVITRLNEMLKTQILRAPDGSGMLFGYQENGWGTGKSFGIKISRPGIDVSKATDDQLVFSMDMETWKWQDDTGRNYVNIGLRPVSQTIGFEMAKPGQDLS